MMHNPELVQRVNTAVLEARAYIIQWSDERLQESFPGSNLTIQDIYDKVYTTYMLLKQDRPAPTATIAEPLALATLLATDDIPYLSTTKSFLRGLVAGNLTRSEMRSLGMESIVEVRKLLTEWGSTVRNRLQETRDTTQPLVEAMSSGGSSMLRIFSYSALMLIQGFSYAFNLMLEFLVFLATLYYLLLNAHSPMHYLSQLLVLVDPRHKIRLSVERTIKAILLSTLKISAFHALFTWLTFSLTGIDYVYFPSFVSGLMAAIPLISPFYVCFPAVFALMLQRAFWSAAALFLSHLWAFWVVDTAILSEIPGTNPYVAGYAIFLGMYAFGLEGVVLGPIIACFTTIIYHIFAEITQR
jgi:predicted PurR-regulated permease PerM